MQLFFVEEYAFGQLFCETELSPFVDKALFAKSQPKFLTNKIFVSSL